MAEEFIQGDSKTKLKLIFILAFVFAAVFLSSYLGEVKAPTKEDIELQVQLNLLIYIIIAGVLWYSVFLALQSANRIKESGRWPLPGQKMPFKTRIQYGKSAHDMRKVLLIYSVVNFVLPFFNFYAWYTLNQIVQSIR